MFWHFADLYALLFRNRIDLGSMLLKGLFPPGNTLFREKGHEKARSISLNFAFGDYSD